MRAKSVAGVDALGRQRRSVLALGFLDMRSIMLFETVGVISAFLSGASWAADDLFLFGAVRDQPYGYYVAWSALPSKVAWAPETGPFPVALDREAKRAEHYLAREMGITNELDLIAIDIHRLVTRRHLLEKRGCRQHSSPTNGRSDTLLMFAGRLLVYVK